MSIQSVYVLHNINFEVSEMDEQRQIRDAVIKLEAKMEVMSDSMISMADSITKLADMRYELVEMKKDIHAMSDTVKQQQKDISDMYKKQVHLEKTQDKNTYIVGKIEVFWTALITGGAAFLWWLAKG